MRPHLVSQLAHVELLTPKPQESLWFFRELMGMEESGRREDSVYLRAWGEDFHHSLKLTPAPQSGLGHMGWRAEGPDELLEAVRVIERAGLGEGWSDGDLGHGRAYRYRTPDDHRAEIFWDVERVRLPAHMRTPIRSRPQKYVGRGAAVRRIDHVTLNASDVKPCREFHQALGFKYHEATLADGTDQEIGAWLAVTNLSHDTAYILDPAGVRGRLNHVAYAQETREEVLRAADIMRDHEIFIEFGPSRHGISEAFFVYVYEPGGNRVEIYSGGYLNFAPDWGPITWYLSEHPGTYWSGELSESVVSYATPPLAPAGTKPTGGFSGAYRS